MATGAGTGGAKVVKAGIVVTGAHGNRSIMKATTRAAAIVPKVNRGTPLDMARTQVLYTALLVCDTCQH
jgi:hypothetical protein